MHNGQEWIKSIQCRSTHGDTNNRQGTECSYHTCKSQQSSINSIETLKVTLKQYMEHSSDKLAWQVGCNSSTSNDNLNASLQGRWGIRKHHFGGPLGIVQKVNSNQHSKHNNRSITILDQASGPLGIVQEVNSNHFITICKYSFPHHLCIRHKLNPLLWPIAVSYLELPAYSNG